jgi:hypothetical protein
MRQRADEKGVDLLLVDTGDRVEGNGLYDASHPKGLFTYDIYHQQDVDIICTGNHELYQYSTAQAEHEQMVPNFKERYIASNVDYIDPDTGSISPMAQRYRKFKTKNQGIEVVAFGFLFDFTGNANNTVVIPVERTVKEEWFQKAIREKPDIFVLAGHVGLRMDEWKLIHAEIRKADWNTPVAILAGHAHVRDAKIFDSRAFGMASGRYLETIGWMSVDGITPKGPGSTAPSFTRKYLDNNLYGFQHHSGVNETAFPTRKGTSVSRQIQQARATLDLDYQFGCVPKDLWMFRAPYPSSHSIYSWLETEVLPAMAVKRGRENVPRLAIFNSGGIRFDIFKGAFTRDTTYIVSPFVSRLHHIPDVPYYIARKVITLLNLGGPIFDAAGFDARYMAVPEAWAMNEEVAAKWKDDDSERRLELRGMEAQRPLGDDTMLTQGYTTIDDIGKHGDDTVHEPIPHYSLPNCVQSTIAFPEQEDPETVDLVFIDFVTPWVLTALRFAGGDYTEADVSLYRDETFTYLMAEWIRKNWKMKC